MSSINETVIDDQFFILDYKNESHEVISLERHIDNTFIQFHFCIKGTSKFVFNNGNYT